MDGHRVISSVPIHHVVLVVLCVMCTDWPEFCFGLNSNASQNHDGRQLSLFLSWVRSRGLAGVAEKPSPIRVCVRPFDD